MEACVLRDCGQRTLALQMLDLALDMTLCGATGVPRVARPPPLFAYKALHKKGTSHIKH